MKPSEFFLKHWRILVDGKETTPTLSEYEAKVMDTAFELGVPPYVKVYGRKMVGGYQVHPLVEEKIKKT